LGETFCNSQLNGSTQWFAPEQAEKDRAQVTDEPLEKETEIVYARNQNEDLQDEVARVKEWRKPELRTNSVSKVNILTLSFKFHEDVIDKS
jgi:hypothetical protein